MGKPKIDKVKPLTIKQQRFVDFYDGNATDSAKKAGYKQPRSQGQRLLTNVDISTAIQKREKNRNKGHIATREERQRFWTRMMDEAEKDSDRLKASELLGRSEADFLDKTQVQVSSITGLKEALDAAEGTGKPPIKEDE